MIIKVMIYDLKSDFLTIIARLAVVIAVVEVEELYHTLKDVSQGVTECVHILACSKKTEFKGQTRVLQGHVNKLFSCAKPYIFFS